MQEWATSEEMCQNYSSC